jgi:hypothetical protein
MLHRGVVGLRCPRPDRAAIAPPRVLHVALVFAGLVMMLAGCTGQHTRPSPAAKDSLPSASSAGSSGRSDGIHETVPTQTVRTAAPVAIDKTAAFGHEVTARIAAIKHINAVAQGVGEVSGPALAVSFVIDNGSGSSIDLGSVTANLQDAAGIPSTSMTASPAHPFAGQLAGGGSSTGTYVFALAKGHHNPLTISLSYTTAAPVVLFVGNVQ